MAVTIQVVIDAQDPGRLARFWADALGYKLDDPPPPFDTWEAFLEANDVPKEEWNRVSAVSDPEGKGPRFYFQRVPEQKAVKNRVHVDLSVGGGPDTEAAERRAHIDAAAERMIRLGGSVLRPMEENGQYWVVMQDPEGNEFCLQ